MNDFNVVAIIGNGFDVSVLGRYRKDGVSSKYSKFCDFLIYKNFNKDNIVFKRMQADKAAGKDNWSDFENTIDIMAKEGVEPESLENALNELSEYFYEFIDGVADRNLNIRLNRDARNKGLGEKSLKGFLMDLSENEFHRIIRVTDTISNYTHYEFSFLNLNYTYLFDNYIHLGKDFDPHPYVYSSNNICLDLNSKGYCHKEFSTFKDPLVKLVSNQVMHPHGCYSIPDSLIFGTANNTHDRLNKNYWFDNSQKYTEILSKAQLIVVFGCSLGESDAWWWNHIYTQLKEEKSYLMIYFYNKRHKKTEDEVRDLFIERSGNSPDSTEKSKITERIAVRLYENDSDHDFCGLGVDEDEDTVL